MNKCSCWFKLPLILMVLLFLFCGAAPVFSQEILATFHLGLEAAGPLTTGLNVLFIGKSGFTVSGEISNVLIFNDVKFGAGLGYVYYDSIYIGGLASYFSCLYFYNGYLAFAIVGGYDFGNWVLGGQSAYTLPTGVRFTLAVGVNVGKSSGTRATRRSSRNTQENTDDWWKD